MFNETAEGVCSNLTTVSVNKAQCLFLFLINAVFLFILVTIIEFMFKQVWGGLKPVVTSSNMFTTG